MKPATFHASQAEGFTLVELIVASAIGLLVTIGGLSMWLGNLRATTALNNGQNLRDQWSRVALFINADIAEACAATGTATTLTLTVDDTPATPCADSTRTVVYSINNGGLDRNGPTINNNGTLNLGAATTTEQLITGVTAFNATCTTALEACYTLTLTRGNSTYTGTGEAGISGRLRVREY